MYKILKIEGDTILLGDEDKKILTVSKADFSYDNPEIGDVVQVFQNDDSMLVVKIESEQKKASGDVSPSEKSSSKISGKIFKSGNGTKPLYKKPWFIGLMVVVVLIFIGIVGGSGKTDTSLIPAKEMNNLYANPDEYEGRTVKLTGRVFNTEKEGDSTFIQFYHDVENNNQDTVVISDDPDLKVSDDDYIRVEGSVDGEFSGENMLGGEISCPQISATKIEKISATEAIPAEKTVKVNKTITRGNYKATVKKVDFTGQNVRIYLNVKNNSSEDFENYPDQGKVIQGGKQYEVEYDFDFNYPDPSTSIKSGASSASVIVFKGVKQSDFKYTFGGYDSEYNDVEFSFDIKVK